MALAQGQKPGEMINIGIGDEYRPDWRLPLRAARVQAGRRNDLLAEIRRSVEKQPALTIGADGERGLAARLNAFIPAPGQCADRAQTIPLRKSAARRRAQDNNAQDARQSSNFE